MALIGDTVRLNVVFKTFDGQEVDPETITFCVYDCKMIRLFEPIELLPEQRIDTGKYYYDYTIPYGVGHLIYEFKAIINGKPFVNRGVIEREFVNS